MSDESQMKLVTTPNSYLR